MRELDEIEKALEPKRLIRIAVGIFILVTLAIVLVSAVKLVNNKATAVERQSRDYSWFISTFEEIKALDVQILSTKTALEQHQAKVDSQLISKVWVSRDDKSEARLLANHLIDLTSRREALTKEYNIAADISSPEILSDLPRYLTNGTYR